MKELESKKLYNTDTTVDYHCLRRDRTPSIDTTTLRAWISESRMGFGSDRGAEEVAASGGGSGDGQGGYRSGAYD
ncbi:hypothetical protein L6452_15671 [Arctium lappa]|uniref:Uncharacterized protein n=1 Tax=Arctium lappa TaxID=4217 RepID=A0ACB9CQ00_ARCLA|nr:hypothetical protein L6452_15671 [Arctium lappa]